jgi:hypothetical protein
MLHLAKHLLCETASLHLVEVNVGHKAFIFTSKRLIRDVFRVKLFHQMVVELKPFAGVTLPILDVRDVVALLSCTDVNNCTLEVIVVVLRWDLLL